MQSADHYEQLALEWAGQPHGADRANVYALLAIAATIREASK